ncbi:YhgE/Pip domain-containing protein [Streptomyces sp. HNM0574]|uniref:YhgE/Pip domain-containing protein n=1 Tax=Streptomyces sp. HNM0574 TaxID=2714954 RepID=UPI00146CC212|nr:YhgE/Pip domain-containing protein [Streptomyces sp. HNM0574]NLU67644.1 YhgE/Pip domain-containing protein [Streptomyces sp. HNM0574]
MRSPRLAALELKRFGRGKLPRAAMAAMLLLPLLYGALYLWSFWDPYDRLDKIPVALVNEDKGTQVDGEKLAAGDSIVKALHDSDTFDWQETGAGDARKGVEDGSYYLSLTIPSDFSERVASSSGDSPETGALQVKSNDSSNYIVGQISRSVFSEVRAAASSKTSRSFFDKMFVSFSTLHGKTTEAAEGAGDLEKGAGDLEKGVGEAKDGAGRLKDGLGDAKNGSGDLKSGTSQLANGAGELHDGAKQVSDGTQKIADMVNGVSKDLRPTVSEHEQDIATAARDVSRVSKTMQDNLEHLPTAAKVSQTGARGAYKTLNTLYTAQCEGKLSLEESCPELKKAVEAAETTQQVAEDLNALIQREKAADNLATLDKDLDKLQKHADALAERAPNLTEDLDAAVKDVNRLNKGAHQVATGAGQLHTGLVSAQSGASELDSGLGELSAGAKSLDGGLYKLADGSGKLTDGSGKLSEGLKDGAEQIPDYDKDEREDRTGVMADPIDLNSDKVHAAPNYGTGFAPYFIPLSLWVGAMVAYMLLQPLNKRALASGAPAWRIALAAWLPVAAIGVLQVGALLSVLHWGLGLEMARGAGTVGFLVLVTVCFTSIIQFLNARFGPAGRILVLAMLMLQLTSAGGTYPIQTSPGFFNALHPYLPMTYVVEGLRHLITGGDLWTVWRACLVLLAFTVGSLLLTAFTARQKQVWSINRLHPEISL